MGNNNETITAISTGAGFGAISIVRMSGKDAIKIADSIFKTKSGTKPSEFEERKLVLGTVSTKNFNEQAMCVVFVHPKSYTGEDLVEFQCHGGPQIANGIMRECISFGARPATNGEFTKRAFLNGKMSLSSAEGMMDMINAESDAEVRAGYALLEGKLSKFAVSAQSELVDVMSEIEVSFDYPEETIEYITKTGVKTRLKELYEKMKDVIATSVAGKMIKSGINVLIIGKPNVGKSSLLNSLLQTEKAIVTDVAGTTRDIVEGTIILGGTKINFTDTAGIRETDDKVEKIGVDKAKSLISQSDIVLFLVDSNRNFGEEDEEIYNLAKETKHIVVRTKSDLNSKNDRHFDNEIEISSVTGSGIEQLKSEILKMTDTSNLKSDSVIITNERHKDALVRASECISRAIDGISENSLDLVSVDIRDAYSCIGEITGNTTSEEIIDAIFSKFCLGK